MLSRPLRAAQALSRFYEDDLADSLSRHRETNLDAFVLEFFRGVVRDVPAYRAFLERQGFVPEGVNSLSDFSRVPATTKENYQRAFSLGELCRGGSLDGSDFFALSSGSTGEPAAWPRFVSDEIGTAMRFEQVLRDTFGADRRRTLGVVCFALGSWVGGMYTTFACRHVAAKGCALTLVTPGNNKIEILRAVRALGPDFEQVVLFGYPPFLKEVIDFGRGEGLDWARFRAGFVCAGEVFSEEWRTLVCERLGGSDPRRQTASLYGTADGGVLANETPLSIGIRRLLAARPELAHELFGQARLPTLCQYDPLHRYFECEADELVFSGDGGVPLVRYKILDRGGLVPFERMLDFLATNGLDPFHDFTDDDRKRVRKLPFVYVFGRSNFALSFYGANVYPENVAVGLEQPDLASHVTGKFVMQIRLDDDQNPELEVVVELATGTQPTAVLAGSVAASIRSALLRLNSEFRSYTPEARKTPAIRLLTAGDPEYFPSGVKHRYTRG